MGRATSDELEIVRCAILFSKGWKKEDIARELGIKPLKVTQNLKTATEEGIIKLESQIEVAEKIRNDYKLRDVYVFVHFLGFLSISVCAVYATILVSRSQIKRYVSRVLAFLSYVDIAFPVFIIYLYVKC